jgi:hypothetical protein
MTLIAARGAFIFRLVGDLTEAGISVNCEWLAPKFAGNSDIKENKSW